MEIGIIRQYRSHTLNADCKQRHISWNNNENANATVATQR